MKKKLLIAGLLFLCLTSFGQVMVGTYWTIEKTGLSEKLGSSKLNLNSDHTFTYNYSSGNSCWAWYNVYGKWETRFDTLVLTNSVGNYPEEETEARFYKIETILAISQKGEVKHKLTCLQNIERYNKKIFSGVSWGDFEN